MTKPTKRKRSGSEGAEVRIVASEVMLRATAISYAAVAALDPSHPMWHRCWLELRCAAIGMVAELEAAGQPVGHLLRGRWCGDDMKKWPTAKHFSSRLSLATKGNKNLT